MDGRILGVDPGTLLMGFGIIDQFQNNLDHVVSGVIRVKKSTASISCSPFVFFIAFTAALRK